MATLTDRERASASGAKVDKRVPTAKRIVYAVPAFALAVVAIPVYVYLPKFYTDAVGVPISALGCLLLFARVFDAVIDPGMGLLSDVTRTRFGRRRPYIAGGAVLLAAYLASSDFRRCSSG